MIICHVWDADYPWDVRVEKICDSLIKKHEVRLVCRNSLRRPRYECVNNVHIHRLPCLPKQYGQLNRLIGFPAFFNPVWIYNIWWTVRRTKADVILVRDLPLALTAVAVGRLAGIPVVLDMAENYPAMIRDLWDRQGFSVVDFCVRNPKLVSLVEHISLKLCDHIVVVVEESRDRLVALGIPPSKVSLVINTPTTERLVKTSPLPDSLVPRDGANLVLVYLGLLEWPRGIETAIRAIASVRTKIPGVRLLIVGSGRHERDFHSLVEQLNLQKQVKFLGWLDYAAAIRVIDESDIGIVPHHATESWNTTVPNKLFDYMSKGKPVIVSNAKPVERIVREEKCGIVFQERDSEDLARAIVTLEPESIRTAMGRRGRDAVAKKYNWAVDEQRLYQALETVVDRGRS
jgi:glycosyltransferase involved in cell wall biosynthesis